MKPFLFILPFCLSLQCAVACLNDGEQKHQSTPHRNAATPLKEALAIDPKTRGELSEARLAKRTDFWTRNQYAVAIIYQGRLQNAIGLLEGLEEQKPGSYMVAANLGTAYELLGDNKNALHWIQEGIRRYPNSHFGTEWLHVKILEAKIAHAKDARHFQKHSVLDLKFSGESGSKTVSIGNETMPLETVKTALRFQLGERLQFVKRPDPSVASLLFDYAAIEALEKNFESARDLLRMALNFGYPQVQGQDILNTYNRELTIRSGNKALSQDGK